MKKTADTTQKHEAEVIDIMPFIKAKKPVVDEDDEASIEQTLSDLIQIMELSTDDIAGTLVARLVYEVDLLPDVKSSVLFEELELRIRELKTLLAQLREVTQ